MKSPIDPTGYGFPLIRPAKKQEHGPDPDFGPLFEVPHTEPTEHTEKKAPCPLCPPCEATLPRAVDAAARVAEGRIQRILRYLTKVPDATLDELCIAFSNPDAGRIVTPNQISGRISDLKRDAYIEWTGQQRATRSGCAADVYRITDRGREYLRSLKSQVSNLKSQESR